jgi:hypothetical protein
MAIIQPDRKPINQLARQQLAIGLCEDPGMRDWLRQQGSAR